MGVPFLLPRLGPEMESALLAEWLVAPGDEVAEGQPLATVETDKVTSDLEAPAAGSISGLVAAGEEYPVGATLAVIGASDDADAPSAPAAAAAGSSSAADPADTDSPASAGEPVASGPPSARRAVAERRRGEPLASPVARRAAQAHGVDLATVRPSARNGVIRKRDVEAAAAASAPRRGPVELGAPRPDETVDPGAMRRRIAMRMHASLQETAQITDFRDHDVTELIALRRAGVRWAGPLGFKVSFTDLFVRATALALREVPELNVSMTDDGRLVRHGSVNIGVAVAVPDGLIVPVAHRADELDLLSLHRRLEELVARAREGRLGLDELSGGTFTVTNIGSYGSTLATPILVPGQVGILGTGAFVERPVVREGQLAIGTVMTTSLTIDHRVIDGETAGRFQTAVGALLAAPERLL